MLKRLDIPTHAMNGAVVKIIKESKDKPAHRRLLTVEVVEGPKAGAKLKVMAYQLRTYLYLVG